MTLTRKEENAAATRAALVDGARRLFAARGYADVAIDEIVAGARVTKGALYHHFDDKQALFRAVVEACPSGLVLVGGDGRIALVNGPVERTFGYDKGELLGQPVERLIPERADTDKPRPSFAATLTTVLLPVVPLESGPAVFAVVELASGP